MIATLTKKIGEDQKAIKMTLDWMQDYPDTLEKCEKFRKSKAFATVKSKTSKDAALEADTRSGVERFKKGIKQGLFTAGIAGSVFFKAENKLDLVSGIADWYTGDLSNPTEMQRINIIGFLRQEKNPQIFAQWEGNLKFEENAAKLSGLTIDRELFMTNRRPWLLWQMVKTMPLLVKNSRQ